MNPKVFELHQQGLSKSAISRITGVPRTTVRRMLKDVRYSQTANEEFRDSQNAKDDVPLSEVAIPKLHDCTREEAIADIRALAEAHPEMAMSRNWYRVHGKYAESAWSQYFGTFHELKRQAGIVLSRQQHNLEKQIAKHASVDHYRRLNAERRSYGDKYDKPNSKRFKQAVIITDLHDKHIDQFYLEVVLDTLKRIQPDAVILGGDVFDAPEFGKYAVDPRDWDVVGRIKYVHEHILKPIREICPEAEITFHEGNHEARLLKHLADATPALRCVLSDLHGMTVASLLGLDRFGINYIAKGDLSAYTLADQHRQVSKNYKVYWDSFIVGHDTTVANLGYPCLWGHHHKTIIQPDYNEHFGAYSKIQIGCGHKLDSSYSMSKWQLGFVIATCDTESRRTVFDTVTFSENFAVVGGVYYERKV